MVQRGGAQTDEHLAGRRARDRARPRSAEPPGRRPRGSGSPSPGTISHMQAAELDRRLAEELGLDAVGAAPAVGLRRDRAPHPRAPRARAVRATCASRWPGPRSPATRRRLLDGARTVVSAALCYWATAARPPPGHGRLPRYTWCDAYARAAREARRARPAARRRLPRARRREPARRPRGRGPLRGRLLRQEHDADHAPPRLVGRARHARHATSSSSRRRRSTPTAAPARSASTPARPARSTSRACSTRRAASRTGRRRPAPIPEEYRAALGDQVYGCDICQDVCPWNRGVEKRRAGEPPTEGAEPHVSLVDWLEASGDELARRYDRLYVPRNDPRYLRRNALVALGNTGGPTRRACSRERVRRGRRPAAPRARRVGARAARGARVKLSAAGSWRDGSHGSASSRSRSRSSRSTLSRDYPPGRLLEAWIVTPGARRRRRSSSSGSSGALGRRARAGADRPDGARLRHRRSSPRYMLVFTLRARDSRAADLLLSHRRAAPLRFGIRGGAGGRRRERAASWSFFEQLRSRPLPAGRLPLRLRHAPARDRAAAGA